MYELWARSRETKREYKLKTFDDERQFDFYLDQVDKDIYEWAMIMENNRCIRFQEYRVKIKTR